MSLKVVLSHKTHYAFDKPINLSPHIIRLRPAPHSRTPIEAYSLTIKPDNHFINWQQDPFGNYLARIVFPEKTTELAINVEVKAELVSINPFDFFVEEYASDFPFKYRKELKQELQPYLQIDEDGKKLKSFLSKIDLTPRPINDFLVELNMKINQHLNYTVRMEPGVQTCAVTLGKKLGSCRDFAWLFVQVLRHLGLAARFVSGYLVQLSADVQSLDGPSGPAEDFTDLHAWTEVYIPGAGWIGLDSTSGLFAAEGHIPLACTPSPEGAAPVEGAMDKCEVEFEYSNTVTRIFESPRVTKPYRTEQWDAINALGYAVDKELVANDVRMSMGGEPTFVSIDDMESEQWNTEADGEHKRERANVLSRRLLNSFGKGGMLHHAQGKWYPGEPLPRWMSTIIWRKDGQPIWKNPDLLASLDQNFDYTPEDGRKFLETLCLNLGISDKNIHDAYNDPLVALLQESLLPIDIDPKKANLKDSLERRALAESLSSGIDKPAGFVLPLNWGMTRWVTCRWEFRRPQLFLAPGTSPVGLRLPLDSLAHKPHIELEQSFEPDLFGAFPSLGEYHSAVKVRGEKVSKKTKSSTDYEVFVRTALSIEIRENKLFIFLPPITNTEAFLDLIASIEETAEALNMAVMIEGYEPPHDLRIEKMRVTPDPGVIEVNIHPTTSWEELSHVITTLYEEAHQSRLGTLKFMQDGKQGGTGGGNHVTIGGLTPSDSPLLRNPELLRSLLTFWQHHPSLSYLFSGAFIGPTSQAPRVDEGRLENLYELEIAFNQIPHGEPIPFWLTDRLFRHMLTDLTGNTHRSEFCIDKLYSPDSSTGRLGILELRGFEMPPHAQMSLVQMLLVRTLVSLFWKKPYRHKLVRWGTQLHDKFLIEHYVREDIRDIVEFLRSEGYAFENDWFDPFFEFRFPLYGMTQIEGVHCELRGAIEPWHVLGEESSSQGTARYVDSSLERVQVKVSNFVDERYVLTCNGVKVPLVNTGVEGEYVSGVRYRAWQPWSALHPTIGVDTPLVFDLVDTWNRRSVGGFTYFVSHPGGRSYDTFPVNTLEAQSRRISRFWGFGHTQGEMEEVHEPIIREQELSKDEKIGRVVEKHTAKKSFAYQELPGSLEYPHTLDLRRKWSPNKQ
ncbi:MAG: transglutaminase family protein [Sulfuricurvum sp.]|uniref:transglutaminase family protein n=1 Tax=Sulfuricurvum sp. TaxID=2025608 RepID=UPI002630D968|nr:transglutaminase family protein [Sulfuricurvum sp.]MDD2829438.1 transglutaminase family protein [Sulfuricurvum sp.]MDD4948479.1 transglutaminase family protein [Sulfuricurvum sp.]